MRLNVPAVLVFGVGAGVCAKSAHARPFFTVPTLIEIRNILAQLEAPIVSTVVERFLLPVNPSLYTQGAASPLHAFLAGQEVTAQKQGRYDYGTLEYPFTLPPFAPDVASTSDPFPPGRFHQDSFTGTANLTQFYTGTLVPLFSTSGTSTSFFFHLSNASSKAAPDARDTDAVLGVDVALLRLLSNRVHIGKVVAEAKFAANVSVYTPLIQARDSSAIRALLTNTTQEAQVLAQADTAASALANAWAAAGELTPVGFADGVRNAVKILFRRLIDLTTDIEVSYLEGRL